MIDQKRELSPLRVRLAVFAVMVVIAIGAIWLIDLRAMQPAPSTERLDARSAVTP